VPFPGTNGLGAALYYDRSVSFPAIEMGRRVHGNGFTLNKTTQAVERTAAGGAFHIADVYPLIDAGRFPVKRIVGDRVEVWADIYRDGHQVMAAALIWRGERDREWRRAPMSHHSDDRWGGVFVPDQPGRYRYAIEAWTDVFASWRQEFEQKQKAGTDLPLDALEGAALLAKAQAGGDAAAEVILRHCDGFLETGETSPLLSDELKQAMADSQPRADLTRSPLFPLVVDRVRARHGSWYQMVPRSQGAVPGRHGTFKDCIARLPDIAAMGFDVICLTPIHPIGRTRAPAALPATTLSGGGLEADPGNPYAVGSAEGGHDAVHPGLGSLEDFRGLIAACRLLEIEVALDFAAQCSVDHPWLRQHPQWFVRRPDGSLLCLENPRGQAAAIVVPDLFCDDAGALWNAWRDVLLFWIDQGVRIFRVDRAHTRPLQFWEWLIHEVQRRHPDVIFLADGITRSKQMKGLAKLGFSQSYSYFTWRTRKGELEHYLNELTGYPERDFYRPNFFVNTPDILPYHLQGGEAWVFKSRLALAATLSGNYGITNGFELREAEPVPGLEEYLEPENRMIKLRDWEKAGNIKPYIRDINRARKQNTALQQTANLRFLAIEDGNVIGFVKESINQTNTVVVAIALSPEPHEFWLPLGHLEIGMAGDRRPIVALENLITGERSRVEWGGLRLRIDPARDPAILLRCLAQAIP